MALTGTEIVYATGATLAGNPAATSEPVPVSQIAALAVRQRGTFVANGATPVTVAYTGMTAATAIVISLNTVGGTVGAVPALKTVTPGTGFTVAGTASDTSTYNWAAL